MELTPGELEPLVGQVAALKPGKFFDAVAFKQARGASLYGAQRPEVFWLRVLDALQTGNEAAALDLLTTEPSRLQAWDPDLAGALARILYFRQKQSLNPPGIACKTAWAETNRPPFFAQLERAAREERTSPDHRVVLGAELRSLLGGSSAFSAALLAAGWREAALQLRRSPQVSPDEPDWLSAAHAEALSLNRSPSVALEFLGAGKLPPASALVRAELLVESGRRDEARPLLRGLAKLDSPAGFRAAFLLALEAVENKDYSLAHQCVTEQPLLAQSDLGKEMLARLALAENRPAEAAEIYRGMVKTSIEAKTWFARQAFAERRWKDAREIINASLELMPDSSQLRESLVAIEKAEAGSSRPPGL